MTELEIRAIRKSLNGRGNSEGKVIKVHVKSEYQIRKLLKKQGYKEAYPRDTKRGDLKKGNTLFNKNMFDRCGKTIRVLFRPGVHASYDFQEYHPEHEGVRYWYKIEWLAYYPGRRND